MWSRKCRYTDVLWPNIRLWYLCYFWRTLGTLYKIFLNTLSSCFLTDIIYIFLFQFQYSRTGTPLQLYFFDDEESLDADQCSSFLGDGVSTQSHTKEWQYGVLHLKIISLHNLTQSFLPFRYAIKISIYLATIMTKVIAVQQLAMKFSVGLEQWKILLILILSVRVSYVQR